MILPNKIELIGSTLCIIWNDGSEDFFESALLRLRSPSAQNMGERDIFGNHYGGQTQNDFSSIKILGWEFIGNYAIKIRFSDGHNTGIYSWEYLKSLQ